MTIETHKINDLAIAEVLSDDMIICTIEDGIDLLGNLYYTDADRVIIYEHQLTPGFFDLKNKMAGEILQKFSNYRVRLAIVGDFTKYTGNSLRDFMYESNKGNQVFFVSSRLQAMNALAHING